MAMPPVAMAPGHLPELAWWPQDWGPSLCAPTLERPLWAGHSWCRGPAGQAWVILLGRAWGRSVWTGACGPVRRLGGAWTSQPLVTDRGQGGGLGSGAPGARRKGPGSTPLPRSPPAPRRPGLGVPGGLGAGLAFPVRLLVRRGSGASDPPGGQGRLLQLSGLQAGAEHVDRWARGTGRGWGLRPVRYAERAGHFFAGLPGLGAGRVRVRAGQWGMHRVV